MGFFDLFKKKKEYEFPPLDFDTPPTDTSSSTPGYTSGLANDPALESGPLTERTSLPPPPGVTEQPVYTEVKPVAQQTSDRAENEIILAKLEAIKAVVDSINARMDRLEQKDKW
jgi:hypothetical protein